MVKICINNGRGSTLELRIETCGRVRVGCGLGEGRGEGRVRVG